MSYLVLARKWRPRRFAELVGQEHVVRALANALDSGRVHHAFLFTGTRGVGKTTIARIFAKSLNCERGVSAEPCGECAVCTAVDAGRFVDLLEIDAASHTGVDDVRELIENAQYMPTRGRYKVYLVDEVHMLSKNAFNALLKTLEEPPEHVKFLLATTDPQKLPVTVLSRCLQFNLKRLTEDQIRGQITSILGAEQIAMEAEAVALLSRAADGSLRDGLSLLDQAIAYGGGKVGEAEVRAMLGTVDRGRVEALLAALAAGDGAALMAGVEAIAGFGEDFGSALEEIAAQLHRVQLAQLVPGQEAEGALAPIAAGVAPELVQLWYQMALSGRRDLDFAPGPRTGFEMTLLRMLAFRPAGDGGGPAVGTGSGASAGMAAAAAAAGVAAKPTEAPAEALAPREHRPAAPPGPPAVDAPVDRRPVTPPASSGRHAVAEPAPAAARHAPSPMPSHRGEPAPAAAFPRDNEAWLALVAECELGGPTRQLAAHAALVAVEDEVLTLALTPALEYLRSPAMERQLVEALAARLGREPRLRFVAARAPVETLDAREQAEREQRRGEAEQAFLADPAVRGLVERYGARPIPESIRPHDE